MPASTDPRLPYRELEDSFLPPRDPVLGYVKVGGKDPQLRYTQAGKPWVAPTRLLDPARFEITTREKIGQKVKGRQGSPNANQNYTVDLGYKRDRAFHALEEVGEAPSSLRVRLMYPTWNQNLIAFLGAYGGSEWVCRGNGVEATDINRGKCPCPCPRLKQFSGPYGGTMPKDGRQLYQCKPHAELNVILEDAGVFGGFWPFKTTSFETISNLTKSLRMFQEMFKRVDGLPLELRVMAATKQLPGGGTTTQPIVTLVLAASMNTARQVAADAAAESRKFLPAGGPLEEAEYREAIVVEMETEAKSYADEFLQDGEPRDDEEEAGGPSVQEEAEGPTADAGAGPEDQDATPSAEEGEPSVDAEPKSGDPDEPTGTGTAEGGEPSPVEDEVEGATREEETDPDGFDEPASAHRAEPPDDSDRNKDEEIAREVLEAIGGWTSQAIKDRLAHHVKQRTLDELLERLERNQPEAWAKVTQKDIFAEPDDGLAS